MYVHAFGAYFGLAVSFVFGMKEKPKENSLEGSSYESDLFAMIGEYNVYIKLCFFRNIFIDLIYTERLKNVCRNHLR